MEQTLICEIYEGDDKKTTLPYRTLNQMRAITRESA